MKKRVVGTVVAGVLAVTGLTSAAYAAGDHSASGKSDKIANTLKCELVGGDSKSEGKGEQGLSVHTDDKSGPSHSESGKPGTGPKITIKQKANGEVEATGVPDGTKLSCTTSDKAPAK